ncbi:MAG: hypothetical protein LQ346_005519 [Caloplaca aetnensis]|nr:MAG: hypothetical protein LQ346_005519 [Caloplaca aetnensis]
MSSPSCLPKGDSVALFFGPKVPENKAQKRQQRRRELKKMRRSTKLSRTVARNTSNHAFHNRLGRAWLTNECSRVDRSGIPIPVQRELMVAFSSPEIGRWRMLERSLSSEAKVVYDRFMSQMTEAKAEQKRGGFPHSKLKRWWVDVQGQSGRRQRRQKMREEGLLGAGYGERVNNEGEEVGNEGVGLDNEGEGLGMGGYRDEDGDGEEVNDEDEDSGEQDSDLDSNDEIGDPVKDMTPVPVSREMTPVPVSRDMTPVPVSREMTPLPIEGGQRWGY